MYIRIYIYTYIYLPASSFHSFFFIRVLYLTILAPAPTTSVS